jgi:scyllo-inositol 2-dehydrogenase (NADP+)
MTTIQVGLIGYGYAGATFHAPLICSTEGLTLTRIASSNAHKVRQDFPDAALSDSPQDLINAADVDLVVIATPNASHHPLAMQALQAGKHVVLEKPFTVTVAQAQELLQLAQQKKLVLSVFHNRRWDNDFLTARKCIESGMLGEITTYQSHYDRYRPNVRQRWRENDLPGSGTLYDLGAHLIDQALVLFGMPDTVSADVFAQRTGGAAPDYFHLVLGYANRRVILHSGSIVSNPGLRLQVHGSAGSYVKYGFDPQEDALRAGRKPGDALWGCEPEAAFGQITLERDGELVTEKLATLPGSYLNYYQGMADAIANGAPPPVSAAEALAVIKIIDYTMQSSREQRVIALPAVE